MYKIIETCDLHILNTAYTAKCHHIQEDDKLYWYGSFEDYSGCCMFEAETLDDLRAEFRVSLADWLEYEH